MPQLLHYDFHIHSCLSPCADDDMTPDNICGMAKLKGLNAIAVTDHNTARNLRAVSRAAANQGLLLLPGLELCTQEEVHILAYFPSVQAAEAMGAACLPLLGGLRNNPAFYGRQIIYNETGEEAGEEDALLIGALQADLSEVCTMVRALGGVPVPAHPCRGHGLVTMLGFFPEEEGFTTSEASDHCPLPEGLRLLRSSDAHQLGMISERGQTIRCIPNAQDIVRMMGSRAG